MWTLTTTGTFSTKSAYNALTGQSLGQDSALRKLWHSNFSPRASLFCWKLLKHVVPVDQQIQRCGVNLASRCVCCKDSHFIEDETHLFAVSDLAGHFWSAASRLISMSWLDTSHICRSLYSVIQGINLNHPVGFVTLYVIISTLWEIWRTRCSLKFEDHSKSLCTSVRQIMDNLQNAVSKLKFKMEVNSACREKFQAIGLSIHCPSHSFILVRWKAAVNHFTLNVDGASKGNPGLSGGGGCFRNIQGHLRLGFSYFYGEGSNMTAEGRALLDGLRLAQLHRIRLAAIYTDSMALIMLLNQENASPPWPLLPWWGELKDLLLFYSCPVMHIYREGNQVADSLANIAVQTGGNQEFLSLRELPIIARGYAIADAIGLPNFRRRLL